MGRSIGFISFLLIVLVLLCVVVPVAGVAYYKWAPEEFNEPHTLTEAEFRVLRMNAEMNCRDHLTDRLVKTSFLAVCFNDTLQLYVNTNCQPSWDTHIGNGRFSVSDRELRATYGEAGANVMKYVEVYLPGVDKERVLVFFAVRGIDVGIWCNGVMKLEGE